MSSSDRPVRGSDHAEFTIERTYPVSPEKVFRAFADAAEKSKWFGGPSDATVDRGVFDFRTGGREALSTHFAHGAASSFEAIYHDIVENERIVYSYTMDLDDVRISASLATLEFAAVEGGTRLTLTEQGVYLDGTDNAETRRRGTEWLLDELGASLAG